MTSISDILRRKSNYLIIAVLTILILVIYWQIGKYSFIAFDEDAYVYENPHVQRGLAKHNLKWAFTTLSWLKLVASSNSLSLY
jgi:hypothetical protein